jgi:hypothetical protein
MPDDCANCGGPMDRQTGYCKKCHAKYMAGKRQSQRKMQRDIDMLWGEIYKLKQIIKTLTQTENGNTNSRTTDHRQ